MSSAYIVTITRGSGVERKLVNDTSWSWLWNVNAFTDEMVEEFRQYHAEERIGRQEAYEIFHKASARNVPKMQETRAQLLVPSLFHKYHRCGGVGVTQAQIAQFVKQHKLWQWNSYDIRA